LKEPLFTVLNDLEKNDTKIMLPFQSIRLSNDWLMFGGDTAPILGEQKKSP